MSLIQSLWADPMESYLEGDNTLDTTLDTCDDWTDLEQESLDDLQKTLAESVYSL
jgi:hypothetical protein